LQAPCDRHNTKPMILQVTSARCLRGSFSDERGQ
jgi:hypothetical protein